MNERYIELPGAPPLPRSMMERIDIDAVEEQWQRKIDSGELLKPGQPGYEEAQQRLVARRAAFAQRFGLPEVELV